MPQLISLILLSVEHDLVVSNLIIIGPYAVLLVGLALRLTWARAVLLGAVGFNVPWMLATWPLHGHLVAVVLSIGPLLFLAPWRRGELTRSGWALALLYTSYCAAQWSLSFQITTPSGELIAAGSPVIALYAVLLTGVGIVLRARWAAVASFVASAMLLLAAAFLTDLTPPANVPGYQAYSITMVSLGVVASAISAVLARRSARSTLGTLKNVLA